MLERRETLDLLARYGVEPRRALGQNFVVDPQLVERIVEFAGVDATSDVVEIGPGLGTMTRLLVREARRVVAVEKDPNLVRLLREQLADGPGVPEIIEADAMGVDWTVLLDGADEWTMVANLPYNVAVPLLMNVLDTAPMITRAVVMVQKEVADRLTASPGGRTIGAPTIHMAWYAHARTAFDVPPSAFHPQPRVVSTVMDVRRRPPPSRSVTVDDLMTLVDRAFQKRRKMLRSSIGGLVDVETFDRAGIDATSRPETLSLDDWVALAEAVRLDRADG